MIFDPAMTPTDHPLKLWSKYYSNGDGYYFLVEIHKVCNGDRVGHRIKYDFEIIETNAGWFQNGQTVFSTALGSREWFLVEDLTTRKTEDILESWV